jgi:hypothetical protein
MIALKNNTRPRSTWNSETVDFLRLFGLAL